MRKLLLVVAIVALTLPLAVSANAYTKQAARAEVSGVPYGLSADCTLSLYNFCAGWIWRFTDVQGAVWGLVLDPNTCESGCPNGGAVSDIYLYSRCDAAPGLLNGLDIETVDAVNCLTGVLYHSGPLTTMHCIAGDRWTHLTTDLIHLNGNPFALTVEWSGQAGYYMSTECGIANLFCMLGYVAQFPGCAGTTPSCVGWTMLPQATFIYVTDFNGDTILDDFCDLYGVPYAVSFPYLPPYGYITNNLAAYVGLDCSSPTAVENTSWGHVKALFE